LLVSIFTLLLGHGRPGRADEGMWLFNDRPARHLQDQYDFEPTPQWAEHVMLSSVRFNSGGSASFVSSTGLVLTNHHVAADTLYKLSTPEKNYHRDGFLARSIEQEERAPDLELNQLVSIEDVTAQVNSSVTSEMSTADAFRARRAVMAEIEKDSLDETGLRSDVITLYGGAKYHLYRYKKYTDVRIVWAPESAIAFFGGDPDNFEYPRYCLDVSIFRVYEDGKPAKIDHFFRYSQAGAGDGELVFVAGNPGRTRRIYTAAALKYQRDRQMPYVLDFLRRREIMLQQYGYEGDEQKRRARDELFGIENSRKAYTGMLQGLQDPAFLGLKERQESEFLAQLQQDASLRRYVDAWDTVEEIQRRQGELLGQTAGFASRQFEIAQNLVLMAAEDQKPSPDRLREYRDSARESLEQQLFSPAPIYDDLERLRLADSISLFMERRGGDDPLVAQVLNGKSPQERANELIDGTKLGDVETRRHIAQGGQAVIDSSDDPMIELARFVEPEFRRLRELNDEIDELQRQAYAQIAEAKFAAEGTSSYPDATFTLRLAFGTVKGYTEDGKSIPPWTNIGGAYAVDALHGSEPPWRLPDSWRQRNDRLDLDTPFNFVCTADIIGGNSGSPVINRHAELVGVIFDGNIQSLTADYFYSDKVARAVSVHSSVILEALRNVYDAGNLADELGE
jgi:hypothetical protein